MSKVESIAFVLPTSTRVIKDGAAMEERGEVAELSLFSVDAGQSIIDRHPEVTALFTILYTPSTDNQTHISIVSDGISLNDMRTFVDLSISSLLGLRKMLTEDPDALGVKIEPDAA